ncbi:MAG: hypothetical protein HY512_01910 [Candidatus Aenigmarchaeota archaeon]|nr:hypothetical protein [Candidatus Aenigmarchaeota archaeon]
MGILTVFEKNSREMKESDYKKEQRLTEERIKKCLQKGDYLCASLSYQLLAKVAEERQDYDSAVNLYKKALDNLKEGGTPFGIGWLYRLISNILFKQKKYNETIENAIKSAEYFVQSGSIYAAQWSYNLAAKAAEAGQDFYTAMRFYKKSLLLADDDGVKQELERLKKISPHPIILELVDRKQIKEGEEAQFKIIVENNSLEPIRKVKLVNDNMDVIEEIDRLGPHEEKYFSYKTVGRVGTLKPSYRKIFWENSIGDTFEESIDSAEIRVVPNIEVITSINPPARLNKPSDFIVLIKNKSESKIKGVQIYARFPDSLKVIPTTKTYFESINPDEEKGAVFSVTPIIVGETKITNIVVRYRDELGVKYEENIEPFFVKEIVAEPEIKKSYKEVVNELGKTGIEYLKTIEKKRREIDVGAHPISQEEFLRSTKTFFSEQRGYTLDHISLDHVVSHILDACSSMTLISSHKFENESLLLFSGINLGTIYLLTIGVKEDGGLVNVLFKGYSNRKDSLGNFVGACADLVEYTTMVMSSAKEVEKIEVNQVIKIIDSIVQRSKIGADIAKNKETVVKDSIVQRAQV